MRRFGVLTVFALATLLSTAQIYVLKDHRDTVKPNILFDTLPVLCDSFFQQLKYKDIGTIKAFVPGFAFIKQTLDSHGVEYKDGDALYRQQKMQHSLEFQYKKALKHASKMDVKLEKLTHVNNTLEYGTDDKGNEFCFVSINCAKRKREYAFSFLAIKLNDKWFLGDDLKFEVR
jgi:hypothetical protein